MIPALDEGTTDASVPMAPPGLVVEALKVPLLVESLLAKRVEDPNGEAVAAYEVTLKGVLPEAFAAELLRMVRGHRIVVEVQEAEEVER